MTTMTNLIKKYAKKITALALAATFLSLPLTGIASAHGRHDAPPPLPHHDRYERNRHNNDNYVTKAHSNRKAATTFVIGAVLGAVIAKNT